MDIQIPQILFQIINFSVVVGALTFLLYKPILKMLEERSMRVEQAQKAAEETLAEKKNIEEIKRQARAQAEKDAATIMDEATKDAAARKKELMAQAKKEAMGEMEKLMKTWDEEKSAYVSTMKAEFADAVIETAQKVIGASLSKKDHAKLIDTELETLLKHI